MEKSDLKYMQLALDYAKKGYGFVSPNPMVGAVVVKDDQVLGIGYHQKCGEAHAEVNAINNAKIENCKNATIYVTLEPCSTYGKTPPCTELIIKSGITKVVIGCLDPNPNHAGRAIKILQAQNIEVISGILDEKCKKLNEVFFKFITTSKPSVTLKMAMTLDGKIACKNGQSQWITSDIARNRVQYLRQGSDAIIVGSKTILEDHPTLFARNCNDNSLFPRKLKRFVASTSMTLEQITKLYPTETPEIINLSTKEKWDNFLTTLGENKITSLLIEGGGELAASALQHKVVDIVEFHIAPKILGGSNSRSVVAGSNPISLNEAIELTQKEIIQLGDDIAIRAKIKLN